MTIFLDDVAVDPPIIPPIVIVAPPVTFFLAPPLGPVLTIGPPAPAAFLNPPDDLHTIVVPVTGSTGPVGPPGPHGPAGPVGPVGPVGPPSGTFVHTQTVPASVWTITHGLGYDPGGVVVITADGWLATEWALQYLQAGQSLRLSFDLPIAGSASLS